MGSGRVAPDRYVETYRRLSELVRRVRMERGLSQLRLSIELGQGSKYIWRIEHGRRKPNFVEFLDIMKALGIDPGDATQEITIINEDWQASQSDKSAK